MQPKKKLTVIAKHRRLGEESLSRLKEEVRKYALDHTFKETAKKFGIHHSTVSGWVKARERGGGLGLLKCKIEILIQTCQSAQRKVYAIKHWTKR